MHRMINVHTRLKCVLSCVFGVQLLFLLWLVIEDHDNLFVMAEVVHFLGIGVLLYKLTTKRNAGGELSHLYPCITARRKAQALELRQRCPAMLHSWRAALTDRLPAQACRCGLRSSQPCSSLSGSSAGVEPLYSVLPRPLRDAECWMFCAWRP